MKIIFTTVSFFLIVILPACVTAQGLNMSGGIKLITKGQLALVIYNGGLKNDGTFIPDSSTVYFDGASTTALSGSQSTLFNNVTFRGTGIKVNLGAASVLRTLAVEGTTILDADGTSNINSFTLKSSDTLTANVDILTTGGIEGNVTVERFINTGTGIGQHIKSWQFLATPTFGQSVYQSWQESGTIPPGYGTFITGTGSGFDATSATPSLKYYNQLTGTWMPVNTTAGSLQNKLGYMLFVRGDRTVTAFNVAPNNTNMRSKGSLFTPANPPSAVAVSPGVFQSFGNPYASRIEFSKVLAASSGINDVFYVWDPKLSGNYNLGGYQTLSGITGYIPSAGSNTSNYLSGIPSPYIESGQAVFVQGNSTGGNVNFNENCKVSGSRLVTRQDRLISANRQFMFSSLFTNTNLIADGNIVAFENGLGNQVNENDAEKIINSGENFSVLRDNAEFAVEARDAINIKDTIFFKIRNLKLLPYQFRFAPVNLDPTLKAFLIDRFNNSSIAVNVTDSTFIDFNITADSASRAADRFLLVFQQSTALPVKIISIAAHSNQDISNQVIWKVENELDLQEYVIERSGNGINFIAIGNVAPTSDNGGSALYNFRDYHPLNNINFYRIKAISRSMLIQYSAIVRLERTAKLSEISISPNPVVGKFMQIMLQNQETGRYVITITSKSGQRMHSSVLQLNSNDFLHKINVANLASGSYQVSIDKPGGSRKVENVIIN